MYLLLNRAHPLSHIAGIINTKKDFLYKHAVDWATANNFPVREAENRMYFAIECNKRISLLDQDDAVDMLIENWSTTLKNGTKYSICC